MNLRQATADDIAKVAQTSISRGPKEQPQSVDWVYALDDDGEILAVGGFKVLNATVAWLWIDLAEAARGKMVFVYRVIRSYIDGWAGKQGFKRLMAAVDCTFPEGIRLVEHLGFEREATLERFFDTGPAYLYARLIKE